MLRVHCFGRVVPRLYVLTLIHQLPSHHHLFRFKALRLAEEEAAEARRLAEEEASKKNWRLRAQKHITEEQVRTAPYSV